MGDEGEVLVTYQGRRFDVAPFAKRHPGGAALLRAAAGGAVDDVLLGSAGVQGERHVHSRSAYRILEKYAVGRADASAAEPDLVDLDKPVLGQVGSLGAQYWAWIHQPVDKDLRIFHADLLEFFTRTPWYMIPVLWMPLVTFFACLSVKNLTDSFESVALGLLATAALFALGGLGWTLCEYTLHRVVFHWHPNVQSPRQVVLHFLIHGLHHKTPMDGGRLVFPPLLGAAIIAVFYVIYTHTMPWWLFCGFASGKLFGYIHYDVTHYYLHHGTPAPGSLNHRRKVYHHAHHFKDPDNGYGISTALWDYVFGTVGVIA